MTSRASTPLVTLALAVAVTACTASAEPTSSTTTAARAPSPAVTLPSATASSPGGGSSRASPPYIARVAWASDAQGRILRVYPTPAGRAAALADAGEAWTEVLRFAADAATPGMMAQFDCHWTFARVVDPEKSSWNLEPWRPVVSRVEMQRSRCNPGGAEETVPDTAAG